MRNQKGLKATGLKHLIRRKARPWFIAAGLILAASGLAYAAFFQGFETDTAGWFSATRVPTGTDGVPSKLGAFHAEDVGGNAYTFWGGESASFPIGGYVTTVDIYLDSQPPYMNGTGYANDTRFDWDSAIGTPACNHRRDFVFNAGFYTDTAPLIPGSQPGFIISASNNAGRGSSFPNNPGRMPISILDEGWFTFEHRFRDQGGVLAVDLTIRDSANVVRGTWTLSDPSDLIGVTVGGNQYGWFAQNEFPAGLAFDNSALVGFQDYCTPPPSTLGAKVTAGGWITVTGGKATFGLTAQAKTGAPSGNLTYQDHVTGRAVKSTSITSVIVSGNCARILGTATVNGAGAFGFDVTVCDNGEPGKDSDTFSITMSDGYSANGTLSGGNVQIH